jgi:hypothetical protein
MGRGRRAAEELMYSRGYFVGRATPAAEVAATVELLAPVATEAPLIRVGANGDGGYLVPDDLAGISLLFSPGVATSWSFEEDLLARAGIRPVLCDRLDDVSGCPFPVDDFWLGPHSGVGVRSLADWVAARDESRGADLLLQMDIEGSEFATLLACPDHVLARFRILVVEFHEMHRVHDSFVHDYVIRPTLERLAGMFTVVHVHPNNGSSIDRRAGIDVPRVLEVTYHRNDRVTPATGIVSLPHPLDVPNVPTLPEVQLSTRWQSGRSHAT